MISGVFSVFDSKARIYHAPFLSHNRATAMRLLSEVVADRGHAFGKHPMDFTLVELGSFNDETALMALNESPEHICLLLDLVEVK